MIRWPFGDVTRENGAVRHLIVHATMIRWHSDDQVTYLWSGFADRLQFDRAALDVLRDGLDRPA